MKYHVEIKKTAGKFDVDVILSANNKLGRLIPIFDNKLSSIYDYQIKACDVKHKAQFL